MTYLLDTSAWIEVFRSSGGPAHAWLAEVLREGPSQLLGCPPVRMELSADPDDLRRFRVLRVYDGFGRAGVTDDDFEHAAAIYRSCRRHGVTIRSQIDCLVAAISVRCEAVLVHDDVDFDRMNGVVDGLSVLRLSRG